MTANAAIPALILLIIGVALALPSEANIGMMLLETFDEVLCDESNIENVACRQIGIYIFSIRLIGFGLIVANIIYIIDQFKKGNLI